MATKNTPTGFLSKMVQLIRQPTREGISADDSELGQNSEFIKLALKDRIARKRQDDTVRRREFAYLRKIRSKGPLVGQLTAGRPSIFQHSSGFNPEERAMTIKKIDDIEAHMSRNWLERRQDKAPVPSGSPASPPTLTTQFKPAAPTRTETFKSAQPAGLMDDADADYDFTKVNLPAPADARPTEAPVEAAWEAPTQAMSLDQARSESVDTGMSGFSNSKLMSVELGDGGDDPSLQDAAIRFAEGDDAGAEAVLIAVLQAQNEQSGSADAFAAALFDFYRSTGQQDSFDVVAIEYAERFGRSAPEWFSVPDLLGRNVAALPVEQSGANVKSSQMVWECPPELGLQSVQALRASLALTQVPPHLHWGQLVAIHPDALSELANLFEKWCSQKVTLHFGGVGALEKTLKSATPASDMRVDHLWWRLRLDVLCVLRKHDDFEDVALDYCVLYEVSPPSWKDPQCECVYELASESKPGHAADAKHSLFSAFDQNSEEPATVELSGELLGDAVEVLHKLEHGVGGADHLVVSCARLIRVDFSAAGSILNWVAMREAAGCRIQFSNVPRLVAAFFNVIGISEHARIVLRTK
jgi:ABC-type transporter Mla MlaB component